MEWIEVKIHTHSEGVEALCALLMELGAGAVQIEDSAQMKAHLMSDEKNWDYVDEELLNIEEDFLYVQLYLTHDEHTQPELRETPRISKISQIEDKSGFSYAAAEQISLFDDLPQSTAEKKTASKKPSILGGVAVAKAVIAQTGKQTLDTGKKRDGESL